MFNKAEASSLSSKDKQRLKKIIENKTTPIKNRANKLRTELKEKRDKKAPKDSVRTPNTQSTQHPNGKRGNKLAFPQKPAACQDPTISHHSTTTSPTSTLYPHEAAHHRLGPHCHPPQLYPILPQPNMYKTSPTTHVTETPPPPHGTHSPPPPPPFPLTKPPPLMSLKLPPLQVHQLAPKPAPLSYAQVMKMNIL